MDIDAYIATSIIKVCHLPLRSLGREEHASRVYVDDPIIHSDIDLIR